MRRSATWSPTELTAQRAISPIGCAALARRPAIYALATCALAAAWLLGGCGGGSSSTTTTPIAGVPTSTCGAVEYGGTGKPQGLIVSDLPMRGDSAERSRQQVEAIRLVLDQEHWKAGKTPVAFQACDDSIAKTGLWDPATCRANATAYARDEQVLGVIGTYNSGCAADEIPILNRADVAMISPGNTSVCLTEPSPICEDGQPQSLYPSGKRNYARVVPNDAYQGAALAEFAKQQGIARPFVLYAAKDPTSTGQAEDFRGAAEALGLHVAGFATWDPKANDYRGLLAKVKSSGADGVVLGGLLEENGARLIRDKVAVLGSNEQTPMIAFDGFAQQATIDEAGSAAHGMFASVPGRAPESLTGAGAVLVKQLESRFKPQSVEQFAPYAGEAATVLLGAISDAGTDRGAIVKAMFASHGGGILGHYSFNSSGDPTVGPITVLRADSSFKPYREIRPTSSDVASARG